MAILLENDNEQFYLMSADWARLLQMAHDYGWNPSGAIAPELPILIPTPGVMYRPLTDWGGEDYARNNYSVEAKDAARIGQALQHALEQIPAENTVQRFGDDAILCGSSKQDISLLILTTTQFSYRIKRGPRSYSTEAESEHLHVDARASLTDYFSGDMRTCVEHFLQFCGHGDFIVFSLGREVKASNP